MDLGEKNVPRRALPCKGFEKMSGVDGPPKRSDQPLDIRVAVVLRRAFHGVRRRMWPRPRRNSLA
jgi:hypothetical protein